MARTFTVTRREVSYRDVIYKVDADSFGEAIHTVENGHGYWDDEDEYDRDEHDISSVECQECGDELDLDMGSGEFYRCECDDAADDEKADAFLSQELGL